MVTAVSPQIDEITWSRKLIKSSLFGHTRFVHGYRMPYHQLIWAVALEDFSISRLLIIAAPKYGKSPTVGTDYLGWRIGNDPENYHCIYVSNTARQATKNSVALRDTVGYNERYKWLYDVSPDTGKGWGEDEWFIRRKNEADKDPTFQATGVGGPILGATVQEVVFDDIADQENMATEYQRQKLMEWVRATPMSRLVPGGRAIMICTLWHEQDPASEFEKEGWVVLRMPAVEDIVIGEVDGKPAITGGKSTYPEFWNMQALNERLHDLGVRGFMMAFQNSIIESKGAIFKHEWWRYWVQGEAPWQIQGERNMPIRGIVQSWDTAHKEKTQNDFSVCETWYVLDNGFYLVDLWRGKVSFPELKRVTIAMAEQHKPTAVLIEDTASGQDLIPELRSNTRVPVIAITVDRDKVARANACSPTIEAGKVLIPRDAPWRQQWEYEHEIFPRGAHDDQCFVAGTEIATLWGRKPIEDVKVGDWVLTPFGLRCVLAAAKTGREMVIKRADLTGTPGHPIFTFENGFVAMDTLTTRMKCDKLSLRSLLRWKYRKLLYLMEKNIDLWGRVGITLASQIQMKGDNILKDYMWRFGNFIIKGQFQKAVSFTTRMVIGLITMLLIWNVYHIANIGKFILIKIGKSKWNIWRKLGRWLLNGISRKQVIFGIENMLKSLWRLGQLKSLSASNAARSLHLKAPVVAEPNFALMCVGINIGGLLAIMISSACVSSVEQPSRPPNLLIRVKQHRLAAKDVPDCLDIKEMADVYNLTVDKDHVYYACGRLVSNCDTTTQFLNWARLHVAAGPSAPSGIEKKSLWRENISG